MEPGVIASTSRKDQISLFMRNFFKHPKMLGSIIPSSRYLIEHVLRQIDWKRAKVIIEYGPGVGTITREILKRMRPDATLIVLETNPDFVEYLRHWNNDPRLHVYHDSAVGVRRVLSSLHLDRADYVISGIPFSTLPEMLQIDILYATYEILSSDGALLVYQFSQKVLPHLQRVFTSVNRSFEPFNFLPAQLFFCTP